MLIRQKLFQAQEYLHYLLAQVDEHSLHAPFIYDFYTRAIRARTTDDQHLISLRQSLLQSTTTIQLQDLGAGSVMTSADHRRVSSITRHSTSSVKTARTIANIAAFTQSATIIELGTSLGLLSLHLHHRCPLSHIYTIEGAPELHHLARKHFSQFGNDKITPIQGDIDTALPSLLAQVNQFDMAIIDANHTLQATLSYFYTLLKRCGQHSVVIIDDIHWSKEMRQAWDEIRNHPEVTCTIDLFQFGVVFFKEELQKQHWVLTF